MEHFRIIQTMCSIGLGAVGAAFRFQVERLSKAVRSEGKRKEADALEELMRSQESEQLLKPSRVVQSAPTAFAGEALTPRASSPVDKETGAPLAEIHFPPNKADPPILEDS